MPTITAETGAGVSGANSYVTLAEVDAYLADYDQANEWRDSTKAERETAILMAARAMQATYNGKWRGTRATSGQGLDWPRSNVEDNDGWSVSSTAVPQQVKDAQCELASRHRTESTGVLPDITGGDGTIKREMFKVGSLEEETEYTGGKEQQTKYTVVEGILKPLLRRQGALERS